MAVGRRSCLGFGRKKLVCNGGQNGNTSRSGNGTERSEADPRGATRGCASSGHTVQALSPAVVSDRASRVGERRGCRRRSAGRNALGIPQSEAVRRAFAVLDVAYANRDQRGTDAPEKHEGAASSVARRACTRRRIAGKRTVRGREPEPGAGVRGNGIARNNQ